jgi:hypothetical protein
MMGFETLLPGVIGEVGKAQGHAERWCLDWIRGAVFSPPHIYALASGPLSYPEQTPSRRQK